MNSGYVDWTLSGKTSAHASRLISSEQLFFSRRIILSIPFLFAVVFCSPQFLRIAVHRARTLAVRVLPLAMISECGRAGAIRGSISFSESPRFDPETCLPVAARRNGLEFLVEAFVSEVHGVCDAGHRFEGYEIPIAFDACKR